MLDDKLYLALSVQKRKKLEDFSHLILKWQRSINLISNNTLSDIWERHFLDSLQLKPHLENSKMLNDKVLNIVDLGSGAGFPAIVLAIACPNDNFFLIESDQKKASFLINAKLHLGLNNLKVINERIEKVDAFKLTENVDIVTARALAKLDTLIKLSLPFLNTRSKAIFLKGKNYEQEVQESKNLNLFDSFKEYKILPSITSTEGVIIELIR